MNWEKDQQIIFEAYLNAMNMCNDQFDKALIDNYEKIKEIHPIIEFIIDRIHAVFSLTSNWLIWDAEIVLRSALETFVKFLFIVSADKSDQPQLLVEFWYSLAEVYSIKQSEQAKKNLKHTSESKIHFLAYTPQILTQEKEKELRDKWPKSERTKLEQKWSFNGIINSLSKTFMAEMTKDKKPLEGIELLTHSYRMSSHVTHGDETGILIIKERNSRPEDQKQVAYIGHYIRLLSDCFLYCLWTATSTMKYLDMPDKSYFDIFNSLKEVYELTEKYQMEVFNDPLYDNFKK